MSAVALTTVLTLGSAVGANAATNEDDPEVTVVQMGLTGFDADVAAQNGFEIRTTPEGRQHSVPIGTPADFVPALEDTAPAPDSGITTRGTKTSNCGSSYVSVDRWTFTTGYNIKSWGVLYSKWGVTVASAGASEDFNLDHGSTTTWWSSTGNISRQHRGAGGATVNPGSYVLLSNGGLCESLRPTALYNW